MVKKTSKIRPDFTGERVVIGGMKQYITTLQEHIARYNLALPAVLNKKVLDAACGTGYGSKLLLEAAKEVTGVDVSKEAVSYAKSLYPEIKFSTCDLNKAFPKGKFDVCVSFETIEHLDKPAVFLKNVNKNCREFVFSIPLNNPSQYHKTIWTKDQTLAIMAKYWQGKINWYTQNEVNFFFGVDDHAVFLVGHATR